MNCDLDDLDFRPNSSFRSPRPRPRRRRSGRTALALPPRALRPRPPLVTGRRPRSGTRRPRAVTTGAPLPWLPRGGRFFVGKMFPPRTPALRREGPLVGRRRDSEIARVCWVWIWSLSTLFCKPLENYQKPIRMMHRKLRSLAIGGWFENGAEGCRDTWRNPSCVDCYGLHCFWVSGELLVHWWWTIEVTILRFL